jgi:hypothetical protein
MMAFLLAIMLDYRLLTPDYRLCEGVANPPVVAPANPNGDKANCPNGQCANPRVLRWRILPRGRR